MQIRKATRKKAKLRLGVSGPAGSGKTLGALRLAYGITGDWEKICVIDTENHSGELYANYSQNGVQIGEYCYIEITPPYSPEKYITAIKSAEAAGIEVAIIDSLTHAWAGEGGLLDKKGAIEKKTGNGWTAWRDITPMHNRLVETILSSSCHVIATLRAKMEYVQEKHDGKTVIRKVGMSPVQRDGMEYEFTVFIDVDQEHNATSSKDRTSLMDGRQFTLTEHEGTALLGWLNTGSDAPVQAPQPAPQPQRQQPASPPAQSQQSQKPPENAINYLQAINTAGRGCGITTPRALKDVFLHITGNETLANRNQADYEKVLAYLQSDAAKMAAPTGQQTTIPEFPA